MTDKPDLTRVWAEGAPSGNIVDPDITTPGKFASGWQAEVPPFEHFNFIQKLQTQGLAHINEQGIPIWDTETVYPVDALVKGSNGYLYKALSSQPGNDPVSSPGIWVNVDPYFRNLTVDSVSSGLSAKPIKGGQKVFAIGWHEGERYGGGFFESSATLSKDLHDGGKYISPTVPAVEDQAGVTLADRIANFNAGVGETDPGGTGIFVRMGSEFRPENYGVFVYDSRDDAETGFDSSGALIHAILVSRNAEATLVYPYSKFINVGSGVPTQPDGNYAVTRWECNFTTLVRTKVGTTLYVRGGAAYQYIDDLLVDTAEAMWPTAVEATYDDVLKTITPNAEHNGIVIENTKAKIRAESYHNKGFNFHLATTGPNSNGCDYDFVSGNGGACSLYISGTADDLSTSTLRYRTRSGAQGPLYWVEPTAALRQLTAFMAIENGLRDQSTPGLFPTQCYLGGSLLCKYDIYSEIYAQLISNSDEMLADENTRLCDITSHRANRDTDTEIDSTNTWRRPDGKPRKPFGTRSGVIFGITHAAAINSNFDHFVSFDVSGNDGTYGQVSGFANAIGFANRNPDGTGLKFQQMINSDGSGSRREYGNAGTSGHQESLAITKGTLDAPTMFNAGDTVFTQTFRGRTASNYNRIAEIKTVMTDVAAGANFAQGKMIFSVNPYSASTLVDVLEIHPSGNIKNPTAGKGIQLVSPNGTVYTVTVDDTGALVVS